MVTFTRTVPGTYNPSTGTWSAPIVTTITGNAIQVRGNPEAYAALGLDLSLVPTLFFSPTNYNLRSFTDDFVRPGDVTTWNGVEMTVKSVSTIAPDGLVIAARIIASA